MITKGGINGLIYKKDNPCYVVYLHRLKYVYDVGLPTVGRKVVQRRLDHEVDIFRKDLNTLCLTKSYPSICCVDHLEYQ